MRFISYAVLYISSFLYLSQAPSLHSAEMHSVRIFLYSLIFLLGVFGNLLIILVLVMNKRMRTVTNSFLLSLAVSDLTMAIFCMPFTLIPNLLEDFIFGAAMCKIVTYFMGEFSTLFAPSHRRTDILGDQMIHIIKTEPQTLLCQKTPRTRPILNYIIN